MCQQWHMLCEQEDMLMQHPAYNEQLTSMVDITGYQNV
jgi:hypothetical protein